MPARVKQRVTEALHSGEAWTEKVAKDAGHTVGSAAQNAGQAAQDAGQAVGTTANKVKGPALKGVAVAAALGGGIALGRGLNARLRKGRRVLGVPVPRKPAVGNAADRVGHAVDRLGSTGHQIGQWSDDIQYLRGRIAGKPPMDMPVDGESPLVKLAEGKGVRRLVIRTVAKRVLS